MIEWVRRFAAYYNLFPCPLCRTGDGAGENAFCPDCRRGLHFFSGPICPGCGGELDGVLALCSKCLAAEARPWTGGCSIFEYRDLGKRVIHDFKFHDSPELARPLGRMAADAMRSANFRGELVVPVPLHFTRLWRRTYNQAELFGRVTAAELGLPLVNALIRRKRGRKQSSLGTAARRRNPKGAFAIVRPEAIRKKRIILVDDVFTTGATLTAAAKALLAAGSGPIFVLTAARTPRYSR